MDVQELLKLGNFSRPTYESRLTRRDRNNNTLLMAVYKSVLQSWTRSRLYDSLNSPHNIETHTLVVIGR